MFGAAIQGLFPFALSSLTTDLRKAGTRMGELFLLRLSLGLLLRYFQRGDFDANVIMCH